jgi:hypothetical protein
VSWGKDRGYGIYAKGLGKKCKTMEKQWCLKKKTQKRRNDIFKESEPSGEEGR